MNKLLEQAFAEAAKLPDDEQESLAGQLLAQIEADRSRVQAAVARAMDDPRPSISAETVFGDARVRVIARRNHAR